MMKTQRIFKHTGMGLFLGLVLILFACQAWEDMGKKSEHISDPAIGLNGGFEHSRDGLPINWIMYTPNTVPQANFKILLDTEHYTEGKQSLCFDVASCSTEGHWKSPGFTNEFFELNKYGPGKYQISFWLKNDHSEFSISAGAVSEKKGSLPVLMQESNTTNDWKYYSYELLVPEGNWLRMELNILQAGTFWIDDIQINKLD